MENIITGEKITFSYDENPELGRVAQLVLSGVDIQVRKGEFLAVLGHNGSGKSTLAKHFNAVYVPRSGRVLVNGMDTADEDRLYDIRQTVGMVFQNPDNQIVATIVEEDVAFALENIGVPPAEIRQRVDEALRDVGMYEYREHGITVVLITHYMDEAAQCDRVVVMDHGSVIMEGGPREVFSQVEALKAVGLDVPQVTELMHELRQAGIQVREDIITEEECVRELARLLGKGESA